MCHVSSIKSHIFVKGEIEHNFLIIWSCKSLINVLFLSEQASFQKLKSDSVGQNGVSGGSTSSGISAKIFYMVVSIPNRNGISLAAN